MDSVVALPPAVVGFVVFAVVLAALGLLVVALLPEEELESQIELGEFAEACQPKKEPETHLSEAAWSVDHPDLVGREIDRLKPLNEKEAP